jgi:hypothetical protein
MRVLEREVLSDCEFRAEVSSLSVKITYLGPEVEQKRSTHVVCDLRDEKTRKLRQSVISGNYNR